jgi:hypothetical protein
VKSSRRCWGDRMVSAENGQINDSSFRQVRLNANYTER